MSEALRHVIELAVSDKVYRDLLFNEPDKALEGYDLSDEERNILKGLDKDSLDDFAGGLGDRTTKGGWIIDQ